MSGAGTGDAQTHGGSPDRFERLPCDLLQRVGSALFQAMGVPENITFKDTPSDIRDTYQYFTEANMQKLKSIGYTRPFHSLEEGITDYVQH